MEWYVPITILPGISLLILSTVTLTVSLNEEVKQLNKEKNKFQEIINLKIAQLKKLSIAMIGLYLSVFSMVLTGIIGSMIADNQTLMMCILFIGTLFLSFSITLLIIYSIKSMSIRQQHLKMEL